MTDKAKELAEIGFNPKPDAAETENTGPKEGRLIPAQSAPTASQAAVLTAEANQRKANKAHHSERAVPMGRKFRY